MPTTVKFRRGTTAQNDAFTGAEGELSVDTTLDTIRVHDGVTAGGFAMARASDLDTIEALIGNTETTISDNSNTAIDTTATSAADAVNYQIVANKNTDFAYTNISACKDGSGSILSSEYGGVGTALATYAVEINASNITLYADPTTTGVTFKITKKLVVA